MVMISSFKVSLAAAPAGDAPRAAVWFELAEPAPATVLQRCAAANKHRSEQQKVNKNFMYSRGYDWDYIGVVMMVVTKDNGKGGGIQLTKKLQGSDFG